MIEAVFEHDSENALVIADITRKYPDSYVCAARDLIFKKLMRELEESPSLSFLWGRELFQLVREIERRELEAEK